MTAPATASPSLSPGSVVGGRFQVEEKVAEDALGLILRATDQKTKKAITLRVLRPGILDAGGIKQLRQQARAAAALQHRNVAATYGVGTDPSGAPFLASEWVAGHPLSKVLEKRRSKGGHMSIRGAYNVIAHICRALSAAGPQSCHGTLRPSIVIVTDSGRVKLQDFALGKALLASRGVGVFDPADQACLAPEVKVGGDPDGRSDIFGIGAILYLLLTGKSPADGFVPPSQAHPNANEAIDKVLLKCLAADPAARFASPDEVRSALQMLAGKAPASGENDLALDVPVELEVDVDLPGPPAASSKPRPPGAKPQVGQRVSLNEDFRPSAAGPLPTASSPGGPPGAPVAASVDLSSMLAKITENDAPRWMVAKGGLDHGPFSGRELVELIVKSDVLEEHNLMNMDTGERRPVKQWPEFKDFVEQQKIRQQEEHRKAALARAEKVEKRSGTFKIVVAAVSLLVIGGGVALFFLTRQASDDDVVAAGDIGELVEAGQIEIEGTAGILPDPPRRRGGGMHRGGGMRRAGGGGGFAGSYEDAMNVAIELGDVTSGGGQGRLSPGTVSGVMNRHVNRLFNQCVVPEQRSGGRLGNVQIDIAIAGSGSVMGVSARQGSAGFKSCIRNAVRRVRFPSFGAPRMGARYSFSAT